MTLPPPSAPCRRSTSATPVPGRCLHRTRTHRNADLALSRLLSAGQHRDQQLQPCRFAPVLRLCQRAGVYSTTITRPELFRHYLKEQIGLLIRNHGIGVTVPNRRRQSRCISPSAKAPTSKPPWLKTSTCRCATCSTCRTSRPPTTRSSTAPTSRRPASPAAGALHRPAHRLFAAPARHYTATSADAFPELVLFTNYQFYIDEFVRLGAPA